MKKLLFLLLFVPVVSNAQVITTVAGDTTYGFTGDGGAGTEAELASPGYIAVDSHNNLYIVDAGNNRIRKVDNDGIITTIAGNGGLNNTGDGYAATLAGLSAPSGVCADSHGNIYITTFNFNQVRKINTSGIITTIAGIGMQGDSGDDGPATNATLRYPQGVAVDFYGNVYIADADNYKIRKVDTAGIITTIAGTGIYGYSGDGGPADSAQLNEPQGPAVDAAGNVYFADWNNNCIRKVTVATGIISTIAGNGTGGYNGDGGVATAAQLYFPTSVAFDQQGNLYIADDRNERIRKVDTTGIITTIAGNGLRGYTGNGGLATAAELYAPYGIAVDNTGNIYLSVVGNDCVRKVGANNTYINIMPISEQDIKLSPNPAYDALSISASWPITMVAITNLPGQTIYARQNNNNSQQMQVDVSSLPAGVYFVKINGTEVRKFVKE